MEERMISLEKHIEAVESAVDDIAYIRRMAEVDGHDMDKFDEEINKLCVAYHEKYAGMDKFQLALHGLATILKSDHSDEFIEKFGEAFKE